MELLKLFKWTCVKAKEVKASVKMLKSGFFDENSNLTCFKNQIVCYVLWLNNEYK